LRMAIDQLQPLSARARDRLGNPDRDAQWQVLRTLNGKWQLATTRTESNTRPALPFLIEVPIGATRGILVLRSGKVQMDPCQARLRSRGREESDSPLKAG
jgi:hypothetical protein